MNTQTENRALIDVLARIFERWTPNPFIIAIFLTLIVMGLSYALTPSSASEVIYAWGTGLTGLLTFMTQIALAILFGHVLTHTSRAQQVLQRIASVPKTAIQAYVMVTVFSILATMVQWALGLIVGAVLAKSTAFALRKRGIRADFPLLIAGAYSGFIFAGLAYNGTIPLTSASAGSFIEGTLGYVVPLSQTVFTVYNWTALIALFILIPATLVWLRPKHNPNEITAPEQTEPTPANNSNAPHTPPTPAERVEQSRLITLTLGLLFVLFLIFHFVTNGFALSLDIVNWIMLTFILILVRSPAELIRLITQAAGSVGDVLIQFPLYAGILGILGTTGLISVLSDFFISISGANGLPLITFIAAGLVNFAVPSAGGQFAMQGPLFLEAANQLNIDPAVIIMAISYGDTWTNLLQPFFALPLLAIAGLHVRTIFKYTFPLFIVSGLVFILTILWWSLSV